MVFHSKVKDQNAQQARGELSGEKRLWAVSLELTQGGMRSGGNSLRVAEQL